MQALILAGGSGTRFWPASRRRRPKQLLPLAGGETLLAATVERARPLADGIWISTTAELADAVRTAVPEVPAERVLAEPAGRNTAPAIGWSLLAMPEAARADVVAVLPADHRVGDVAAFRRTLEAARQVVAAGDRILALGVKPTRPETGYGYLEPGERLPGPPGLARVARFTEKPDRATAARLLERGALWNAGIFVFRGTTLWAQLERLAPAIASGLRAAAAEPARAAELYAAVPAISIDYAVMEKLEDLASLPLDCGWSDLGSWAALAEVLERDGADNVCRGDALALDAAGNVLWSEDGLLAVLGLRDVVVVRTADAVLVLPKERAQEVRQVVEALERAGRDDLL